MKIEQLSEIEANIYQVLKEYLREFNEFNSSSIVSRVEGLHSAFVNPESLFYTLPGLLIYLSGTLNEQ